MNELGWYITYITIATTPTTINAMSRGAIIQYWLAALANRKDMLVISTNHFSGMVRKPYAKPPNQRRVSIPSE